MCGQRPLAQTDLEPTRFTCNANDLIEASIASDDTIDGTGSTANPLTVTPSTDVGNALVIGTDGKLYVNTTPGAFDTVCLTGYAAIPIGLTEGCLFRLKSHITYADGIYVWGIGAPIPVVTW